MPALAVSDCVPARAKVSVPLAGSLREFPLQHQTHLCTFFWLAEMWSRGPDPSVELPAGVGLGEKGALSRCAALQISAGSNFEFHGKGLQWERPLAERAGLRPAPSALPFSSSRLMRGALYGRSEDGRIVANALMLGYVWGRSQLHGTVSPWPTKFRGSDATHPYPGRVT